MRRFRSARGGILAPLVVLALIGTACGSSSGGSSASSSTSGDGEGTKGGILNMLGNGDVDYIDPNVTYYSVGYVGVRPWSRQLYTYPAIEGKTTSSAPDLATGPVKVSDDGKTVTVTLRDVKWNSTPPRPVTAADFQRGVKRSCNPVQPFGGTPDYADLIEGLQTYCDGFAKVKPDVASIKDYVENNQISGIQAPDDKTVVFKLIHPAAYFQDMLTLPVFSPAPVEFLNALPGPDFGNDVKNLIADGPYYIADYKPTKFITYKRNPQWNADSDPIRKAYVDEIRVTEGISQDSVQQQLETNTPSADMGWDAPPPPSKLPGLIRTKNPNFLLGPTSSSNPYVIYNFKSTNNNGAMQKVEFRQALSYAINRDNIIQVLAGPEVNPPLTHVLPRDIVGGEKDFDPYPHDEAKAKSLLAGLGLTNPTLKFLYRNQSEGSTKVFQTIQQDLSKVGIKVVGVPSPNADFYTKYLQEPDVAARGVWDLSLAGWGPDWYGNGAKSFFGPLFSGPPSFPPTGSNFGFYDSAATNALIKQAAEEPDQAKAADLWAQADHQVMADAAFFPITQPNQPNFHASQVHNAVYIPSFQLYDPTNVWLDKNKNGG